MIVLEKVLGIINFALSGYNVYYWAEGGDFASANLGIAVFCFGMGIFLSVQSR